MSCNSTCNNTYRIGGAYAYPDTCIAFPIQSGNLTYDGPNLPATGINTCNTITVALQKIDAKLLEIIQELFDLTSTTTTTEIL